MKAQTIEKNAQRVAANFMESYEDSKLDKNQFKAMSMQTCIGLWGLDYQTSHKVTDRIVEILEENDFLY